MCRFKKISVLLLSLILVLSLFGCGAKPANSGHSYQEVYTRETAPLTADADGTFRILKNQRHTFSQRRMRE